MTAEDVIEALDLRPHPKEGGYFRETYRSEADFEPGSPFAGTRSVGTAIYYLLTPDTFSAMHRLPGDEVFHFYLGDPIQMLELLPDGVGRVTLLGPRIEDMSLQHVVPGGTWQGSRLVAGGRWALLGTTMSPGFSYGDYETGTSALIDLCPDRAELIASLLLDRAGTA